MLESDGSHVHPVTYPADTILVAEELTPSDTASLDPAQVLGLCTTTGGGSSHVAILARSLEIPLVAGIDPRALDLPNGTPVILDGTRGTLRLNPSTADIARIHQFQGEQSRQRRAQQERAHEPATTLDGHRVEVAANIGALADAEQGVALGAEAVGPRSSFCPQRTTAPSEEESAPCTAMWARPGPGRPGGGRSREATSHVYLPMPRGTLFRRARIACC